jgi:hypothetical protein
MHSLLRNLAPTKVKIHLISTNLFKCKLSVLRAQQHFPKIKECGVCFLFVCEKCISSLLFFVKMDKSQLILQTN